MVRVRVVVWVLFRSVPENRLPLNTQVALLGGGLTQLGIGIGETFLFFFCFFLFLLGPPFYLCFLRFFFLPCSSTYKSPTREFLPPICDISI